MKNLIMADLKVLGHRLWAVPIAVFILVVMISLVPNVNMPEAVRNFMIALLSPGLLIFELLREEKKRNSDSMIMTMPVGKNMYIFARYMTVILLGLTAIPAGWFANVFLSAINSDGFYLFHSFSYLPWMLKFIGAIIIIIYFILPIYFYTKMLKTSILAGLIILWLVIYGFLNFIYSYFYFTFFVQNLDYFFYRLAIVIAVVSVIHIVIKLFFKSFHKELLRSLWFAVIMILLIICIEMLLRNLEFSYVYLHVTGNLDTATSDTKEKYLDVIRNFRLFISALSIISIVFFASLKIIRMKSNDIFYQNCILYALYPLIIFILLYKFNLWLNRLFEDQFYFGDVYITYSDFGIMTIFFIIAAIISYRSSIFLLNNNRTLK